MIVGLGNTPLARSDGVALVNFASLGRLIAGLVIGVLTLFVISEREASARGDCAAA
jgi:hypothetical protein